RLYEDSRRSAPNSAQRGHARVLDACRTGRCSLRTAQNLDWSRSPPGLMDPNLFIRAAHSQNFARSLSLTVVQDKSRRNWLFGPPCLRQPAIVQMTQKV